MTDIKTQGGPDAGQEIILVKKPLPGQTSALAVTPGTSIHLDFPLDGVEVVFSDGNLQFQFDSGEQLELVNFEDVLPTVDIYFEDGSMVDAADFVDSLIVPADEPAAGAGPESGGAGEYDDYMGVLPEGIDRLGTLGPREFGGGNEEPDAGGLDLAAPEGEDEPPGQPPDEPEIPPDPPQANPDSQSFAVESMENERDEVVRFYDIDVQGNVLDNDTPEGVGVVQFVADGVQHGADDLGQTLTLDSGAQFSLSADGTYHYVLDNTETVHDNPYAVSYLNSPLDLDVDPGYEFARITFDTDSLDGYADRILISYTDDIGSTRSIAPYGTNLYYQDGIVDYWDEDGIANITITGLWGEVDLESVGVVDTDANMDFDMGSETIQYTIADSSGATSSADLTFSITNAVPETT